MSKRHQHHGGAWKTAYADFVTAMMALFLLLWLTSQDKKIKEAVERAFRNPFSAVNKESTGIIPNSNKDASSQNKSKGNFQSVTAIEMQMMRKITEDIAKMLQQSQELEQSVQIELTPDGVRINIFDRSQKPVFEPGTDKFTDYGSWVFSTLAWEIARFKTFHIELEGHTETRTNADAESLNKWDLSTERANAARRKLIASGVATGQVFKVSGFADTQPMPGLAANLESNRRVTVLLKVENQDDTAPAAPGPKPAMNEPFLPLNKNAMPGQSRADFRVSIVSDAENVRPFQPLGHVGSKPGAGGQCEPRVTLQRDGERVSSMRIQCSCGQVIELACVYETAPATAIS